MMRVKKGDTVVVIAGKDKGKKGTVVKVMPKANRVVVEGVNVITKHQKPKCYKPTRWNSKQRSFNTHI